MQLYYICEDGFEIKAKALLTKACKKLVVDIHYVVPSRPSSLTTGRSLESMLRSHKQEA
jgi:hypothetical protein